MVTPLSEMCQWTCSRQTSGLQATRCVAGNAYLNYGGSGCLAHRLVEISGRFPDKKKKNTKEEMLKQTGGREILLHNNKQV